MKTNTTKRALRNAASVLAIFVAASSAQAQEAAPQTEETETIVVTGSRIARSVEFTNPNPVVTIGADAMRAAGKTNINAYLKDIPALLGSSTNLSSGAGGGLGVGVNYLNLRNLGSKRTLVLVDGKRHVSGGDGVASVDTNTIPSSLVEAVDVLTGGVSAIYGADGVSGVVNFRMKRDFEGLTISAQNSLSQRGDAGDRQLSATWGHNFAGGRGNIAFAYQFSHTDRFRETQRLNYGLSGPSHIFSRNNADGKPGTAADNPNVPDRVLLTDLRWADSSLGGAVDLDGDDVPDFTGEGGVYDLGTYVNGSPFTIGGSSTPRESYFGDNWPFMRSHIANVLTSFEVSSALKLTADAKYVKAFSITEGQPNFDFYTMLRPENAYLIERFGSDLVNRSIENRVALFIAAQEELLAEGEIESIDQDQIAYIRKNLAASFTRDNFDMGTTFAETNRELFRAVFGASGDISSHLKYDSSFVYGTSSMKGLGYNNLYGDRYYAAIDAVRDKSGNITCRINLPGETEIFGVSGNENPYSGAPMTFKPGECVPLNMLGAGSPSKEALDFVRTTDPSSSRVSQYVANYVLSGDTGGFFSLPGGPVGFAMGGEYRKETSKYRVSDNYKKGAFTGQAKGKDSNGAFTVKEVFGEISLPLLQDTFLVKNLTLDGALRFSDYSTKGTTTTWNARLSYSPIKDISFRGTYSVAVRAPNIGELFDPLSSAGGSLSDPCGVDLIAEGTKYRQANCAAALGAFGIKLADFNPADEPTSPANVSFTGNSGGNPLLTPETGTSWTVGTVLRPSIIPGFRVSLDWYDIKLEDAILKPDLEDIAKNCYDQPTLDNQYCPLFARDPADGFVNNFWTIPVNVAFYSTQGLDMNVDYDMSLSDALGSLHFKVVGNYLKSQAYISVPGGEIDEEVRQSDKPRYSGMFSTTWEKGPLSLTYGLNWQKRTMRLDYKELAANPDYYPAEYMWYKAKWESNLSFAFDATENFNLFGGISNLMDAKPDIGSTSYPIDPTGRSFYLGVEAKF